jgi:hypothetical protein
MVAPDQGDAVRIADLQCKKQQKCFYGIKATIDKIAHKKVIGIRTLAANFEELQQIKELAVDISTNGDWAVHTLHIAFFNQNLTGLGAQKFNLALFDVLTSLELFDPFVHIRGAAHVYETIESMY